MWGPIVGFRRRRGTAMDAIFEDERLMTVLLTEVYWGAGAIRPGQSRQRRGSRAAGQAHCRHGLAHDGTAEPYSKTRKMEHVLQRLSTSA